MTNQVDAMRSFNRFYTRRIGLLGQRLMDSPFSLPEARILYELANGGADTVADLARLLDIDRAFVARIVGRFRTRGLVASGNAGARGGLRPLSLTEAGHRAFAALDRDAAAQMEELLASLEAPQAARLTEAMQQIRTLLAGPASAAKRAFHLRAPKVGDLGWIVHRQALLYARDYGFDARFEGLLAEIVGRFSATFEPAREQAWIADRDGAVAGSVFLVQGDEPDVAKLRLLYVEPAARGLGIGQALVAACVQRARAVGYRRLDLWTQDILVAARRLYQAAGFRLVAEEPHRSFGRDLTGQIWTLDLGGD